MTQTTGAPASAVPLYMTTLDRPGPLPVQRETDFVCPTWCVVQHSPDDLSDWDTGLWIVTHEGDERRWRTARGTTMTAKLMFAEVVGWNMMPPEGDYTGPYVELGGDDASGYMGTHEIDAADLTKVAALLVAFVAEVAA